LLVTMAACHGASLVSIFSGSQRMPVWALLGPTEITFPSDVARGFQAFYTTILKTFNMRLALDNLRNADWTSPENWYFQPAELLLAVAYGMHATRFEGPGGSRAAERTILKRAKRADRRSGRRRPGLRQHIRRWLAQPEDPFFGDLKRRYFMMDVFPENESRF